MIRTVAMLLAVFAVASVAADDLPTVKVVKGVAPAGVAPPLREALHDTSYAVLEGDKEVLHFWVRREVSSSASAPGPPGYDSVEEGTFIGVLEVKDDSFTDFRGQDLHVGVYTLRLSSHPQDGNHMGIAPSPQFLCLVPVGDDKSLPPLERKSLMDLSKKAAKTGHPATLFLEPFFEPPKGELPAIRKNDLEHIVLDVQTQAKLSNGEVIPFPIGLIIIGETDAE